MEVQMRWLVNGESMDGAMRRRRVFWCSEAHARHYLEHRLAELIAAPSEIKPAAPSEVKEVKKSFVEEPAGLSTDSAESNESGKRKPLSVSQPETASTTVTQRMRSVLTLPKRK